VIGSPKSRASTLDEVAYHEAGHVVVGTRLGLELAAVDVLPDHEGGNGHTVFNTPAWFRPSAIRNGGPIEQRDHDLIEAVVKTFLAGAVAEARVAGFRNWEGSGFDLEAVAREWLGLLVPPDRLEARLEELNAEAEAMVSAPENWAAIERLARALLERKRLTGKEALLVLTEAL
jgi:hypothetical protein